MSVPPMLLGKSFLIVNMRSSSREDAGTQIDIGCRLEE